MPSIEETLLLDKKDEVAILRDGIDIAASLRQGFRRLEQAPAAVEGHGGDLYGSPILGDNEVVRNQAEDDSIVPVGHHDIEQDLRMRYI